MALPPSTANWHWKNKNVTRWAKEWFERELVTVKVDGKSAGESVSISRVTDVDGDVELGQRKSKLITIFDCKVELEWAGTTSDGKDVKGKLTIPEVSHEITVDGLSEYQWDWRLDTSSSPTVDVIYTLAKKTIPELLETKFSEFAKAIVATHGKDLTVSGDPSRASTPAPADPAAIKAANVAAASAPSSSKPAQKEAKAINTSVVRVEATFMAAAQDLFGLLTDEARIPIWTRAAAKSVPQPNGEYVLFGGGVKGTYVSLTSPTEIVQTWSLQSPTWPSGHEATLTTTLEQAEDSTKVTFALDGVPKGSEDEIKRNLEGYYIHGLRSIGYVQLTSYSVPSSTSTSSTSRSRSESTVKESSQPKRYMTAILFTSLALSAALLLPYLRT